MSGRCAPSSRSRREKARVEARLLAAYGASHTIESQQVETLALAAGSLHVSPDRVVTEEIALATGVGTGEVARRLAVATAPRRFRALVGALRAGETSLHRVLQVASETAQLPDADVTAVAEAVLAPSRDGRPVPQRTFGSRLRRAVASVDARGAQERRGRAWARRGVFGRMVEDGMGCLTVTADAATVAAVIDRLDAAARSRRGGVTRAASTSSAATWPPTPCSTATSTDATRRRPTGRGPARPPGRPRRGSGDGVARRAVRGRHRRLRHRLRAARARLGHRHPRPGGHDPPRLRLGHLPVDVRTGQAITRPTHTTHPKNWRDGLNPPDPPPF